MSIPPPLLLDTHVAIWLDDGDSRLLPATLTRIEQTRAAGGLVYLSAVSVWEVAQLEDRGRLRLHTTVAQWMENFLAAPGLLPLPLTAHAAALSYSFAEFASRDPADRLLMAAAVEQHCTLLTYDRLILGFARQHGPRYGLRAASS